MFADLCSQGDWFRRLVHIGPYSAKAETATSG